jgi:hypothetical protein
MPVALPSAGSEAIQMSAKFSSWSAAPLHLAPHSDFGARLRAPSLSTTFLKVAQLLETLKGRRQRPSARGGSPADPEEDSVLQDIWNDPAFWMMFMH